MGGNAKAVHRNTGTVKLYDDRLAFAEKILFSEVQADTLVEDIRKLVRKLNVDSVWDARSISENSMFFGSFDCLQSLEERSEFVECKKFIGDVDIGVPLEKMDSLHRTLVNLEEKSVTPEFVYVGQNRASFSGKKLNSIFYYVRCGKFLQVDFEGMKFVNGSPEPYVRFMRSSPWRDVKEGLKGLAHKYLLACISKAVSYKHNIVVLTDKSPLHPKEKIKTKLLDELPHSLTFSKEGLRDKLKSQTRMGYPVMVEGKYAYKEIPKNESVFELDLKKIFKRLFGRDPSENDMKDFESYHGTLDLCCRYLSKGKIESIYEHMINVKLWGKGQALSRDSTEDDKDVKEMIIYTMESKFPYLVGNLPLEKIMEDYYACYQIREEE